MDQPLPSGRESATEPVLRSRLLPRISFQSMLVATTLSALVIAVVYSADQGGTYASAAAIGLLFALGVLGLSAIVFLLSWAVSFIPRIVGIVFVLAGIVLAVYRLLGLSLGPMDFLLTRVWFINAQLIGWFLVFAPIGNASEDEIASPFADDQLPPQILAPREPSN